MTTVFGVNNEVITFNKDEHKYTVDGIETISVTQILDAYFNVNKTFLESSKVLDNASKYGTYMHELLNHYTLSDVLGDDYIHTEVDTSYLPEEKDGYGDSEQTQVDAEIIYNNFLKPLIDANDDIRSEYRINYKDVYVGTCDLFILNDNELFLADYKRTNIGSNSKRYLYQLCLYAYPFLYGFNSVNLNVVYCKDGIYECVNHRLSDTEVENIVHGILGFVGLMDKDIEPKNINIMEDYIDISNKIEELENQKKELKEKLLSLSEFDLKEYGLSKNNRKTYSLKDGVKLPAELSKKSLDPKLITSNILKKYKDYIQVKESSFIRLNRK